MLGNNTEQTSNRVTGQMTSEEPVVQDPRIEEIKGRIERLVEAHFAKPEQPRYFLSQLGSDLGDDLVLLEKLTRTRLAQFVRDNLPYEIGVGGAHKNVLFLVGPGGSAELPVPATTTPTIPRYARRFWAAFAVPLEEGEERAIDLDTFDFGPKDKVAGPGADIRPISAEFIAPKEASGSAAETADRIANWLAAQKLDGSRFHAVSRRHRSDEKTLLEQIFATLDADQSRRVSLPLDVIRALAERKS